MSNPIKDNANIRFVLLFVVLIGATLLAAYQAQSDETMYTQEELLTRITEISDNNVLQGPTMSGGVMLADSYACIRELVVVGESIYMAGHRTHMVSLSDKYAPELIVGLQRLSCDGVLGES